MSDLKLAARSLGRSPLVTAVAVVTIALGIGAVTTLFSVFDAVWLEPLPFREPDRLIAVTLRNEHGQEIGMSHPNFVDLRARTRSFETLSAFNFAELNVIADDRPELAGAHQVLGDFFGLLGIEAMLGRGLEPDDDLPGAEPVVVLSHRYWMTRFGGDPDVVGKTITMEGASFRTVERRSYTIVGVMPESAWFRVDANLWMPFHLTETERNDRGAISAWLFGRLGAGVDVAAARAELEAQLKGLSTEYPDDNRGLRIEVSDAHRWLYGDDRSTVVLLLGAAAVLLLIACGNVAHLIVARFSERDRELSMRAALGASRAQLARLVGLESALLMLAGGGLGVAAAIHGVARASALMPRQLMLKLPEGAAAVEVNFRVLAFAWIAATAAMALSSLPALERTARADLVRTLSRTHVDRKSRRSALVVSEVALSLLLLIGAGVTLRSVDALNRAPLGFEPDGVVDFWVSPSRERYPSPEERRVFYRELRERVEAVPGIETIGFTNHFPHQIWSGRHEFETAPTPRDRPIGDVVSVDAGYFRVLSIALLSGRHFDEGDHELSRPVAIVNRHLADRHWPDEDPVGKTLTLFDEHLPMELEVVGVAADVHVPLVAENRPMIYRPWRQAPPAWIDVVFKSDRFSEQLAEAIRQAIWSVDPDHFVSTYMMSDSLSQWFSRTRFAATLLGAFAVVAFLLSAAGVFAVVSFQTRRRRREMGIRKAVGAREYDLVQLVLGATLRQTALGIAIGLVAAFGLTRFLSDLLFGVSPMDTVVTLLTVFGIATAALLASYLPARRISRIHPASVLRSD